MFVPFLNVVGRYIAILMNICTSRRKEIIAEFKALHFSFPDNIGTMQSQLCKYKEVASDVHSLQANVQSLSSVLDRKVSFLLVYK